jgi:hypothetical protein
VKSDEAIERLSYRVIKQESAFNTEKTGGERLSPQSRKVVALRAVFGRTLARSGKILALRELNRSPLFLCVKNTFLLDRDELTPVACAAENLHSRNDMA